MVTFGFREKYEISKRGGSVIVKGKKSGVSTVEISPWCWEVVECAGKQKHVSLWQACVMVAEKTAFDPNDLLNMVAKDIRAVIGSGIVYADVV